MLGGEGGGAPIIKEGPTLNHRPENLKPKPERPRILNPEPYTPHTTNRRPRA